MSDNVSNQENGDTAASNVVREAQTKRQHVRVQMPISVVIDGVKYDVADWSLGGFGLQNVHKEYAKGDSVKAALSFIFHGYAFTMLLPCEIVFVSGDKSEVGCRFEEITPDQNELIRYLINAHLSGRIATVDGILSAASTRNLPVPKVVDLPAPLSFKEKAVVQFRKGARYAGFGTLAASLVLLVALSLYSRFFTVSSEFAAVTAPVTHMRAAEDGWVDVNRLELGDRVYKGDLLFRLNQPDLEGEIAVMRSTLEREQAQLAVYMAEKKNLDLFFKNYKELSLSELESAEAQFREAEVSVQVAERQVERFESLRNDGYVSERGLDNARDELAQARADLAEAKAERSEARINTGFVDQGYFYSGSRVEGEEPERLAGLIAVTEKNIELYQESLSALLAKRQSLEQVSPCDCIVQDIRAAANEFVEKGTDVVVLQERPNGQVTVEAKVPHSALSSLTVNGPAEVLFADTQGVVRGTIVDISHFRQSDVYSGLPEFVSADPNFGTLLVAVSREDEVDTLGLPTQVRFPISVRNKLFSIFGVGLG